MKYKALILDLDGTVVPSREDGAPSERVTKAIIAAKKYVTVSAATGRSFYACEKIFRTLQIDDFSVIEGGSEIRNSKTGEIIFSKGLSVKNIKDVIDACAPFGYKLQHRNENRYDFYEKPEDAEKLTNLILIEAVKKEDTVKILDALKNVPEVVGHHTTSWLAGDVWDIHITHKDATKKHAIEKLLKMLNVTKEETIGIGDSFNDLPLLNSVGLKIVVGNAPDELKKIADYVAPTLDEDGVAVAIEKFILNSRLTS